VVCRCSVLSFLVSSGGDWLAHGRAQTRRGEERKEEEEEGDRNVDWGRGREPLRESDIICSNGVVEDYLRLCRYTVSPIRRMPAEILTEIFAFFVPDAFAHNKYSVHSKVIRKGIGMLLQLSIISQTLQKNPAIDFLFNLSSTTKVSNSCLHVVPSTVVIHGHRCLENHSAYDNQL
jgi:hypothetical protein